MLQRAIFFIELLYVVIEAFAILVNVSLVKYNFN